MSSFSHSDFVLYNPKNANRNFIHQGFGNYSERFLLDNVTKYPDYSHLKIKDHIYNIIKIKNTIIIFLILHG